MKKNYLSLLLLIATSTTVFAQLKVNSLGNLQLSEACNTLESEPLSATVTIGDDPNYYWGDFTIYNVGLLNCRVPKTNQESIGLYSEVWPAPNGGTQTQPYSAAIWGVSCGSSKTNYGVIGSVNGSNGAGIYGTTWSGFGPQLYGSYAGYFSGATYVDGNLTATALYNLSDMRLKHNITLLSESAGTKGNAIDNLQKLNVISYNLENPAKEENHFTQSNHFKDSDGPSEVELNRRHYGVSAQELQEIYPDLVLEGQDGYLAVNYVELVPILIRSIQELKQELDDMRSEGNAKATRSESSKEKDGALPSPNENILYQNSPNPFKEKTIVCFKLANNVQDASICFFDMNGRLLKKMPISSGMDSISIGGYELGEGMFLYSLIVNGQEIDTKKMVIVK